MTDSPARYYLLILSLVAVGAAAVVQTLGVVSLLKFILDSELALHAVYLGAFLFCMGLATYLSAGVKRSTQKEIEETRLALARSQMLLSAMGAAGVPLACLALSEVESLRRQAFLLSPDTWRIVLWIGGTIPCGYVAYLAGKQLPMVVAILKKRNAEEQTYGVIFGYDYLGCVLGALAYLFVLFPRLGIFRSLFLSAIAMALATLGVSGALRFWNRRVILYTMAFLVIGVAGFLAADHFENMMDRLVFG